MCIRDSASILQVLFQNLIVTAGYPGLGMVLSVSAGAVNIFLDFIFMVVFDMGIKGAALGTGDVYKRQESVLCAIEMGASRIGHGVRSFEDEAVVKMLKERQIPLEMCPISNLRTCALSEDQALSLIHI